MNKKYIADELNKRGVQFEFFFDKDSGPALQLRGIHPEPGKYWNTLLPMDDESDPAFVDFVDANYKRLLTQRASDRPAPPLPSLVTS